MKRSRRYLRLTREGWSFIFILCFIIVGSVLQQINLLVMLAGMMIAPLLFNWRIALNSIFQLKFQRKIPEWAHAGQTVVVDWRADNERRLLPAWGVKVTESIRRDDVKEKKATKVDTLFSQINAGQTAYSSYRCHFGQRGVYHFAPTRISSRFPLGLVVAWYNEFQETTLIVAPRLGRLTESWNRKVDSAAVGVKSSIRRVGSSQDEFFALRPWRSGDSRRAIHWRSSAKHGEPIVKQFDQQTDRDFAIVLDLWQGLESDSSDMEVAELAISFAATVVANVRQKVKGNIAIGLCGSENHLFSDRVTQEFTRSIMGKLAEIQPAQENELAETLNSIGRSVSSAAPLIVISTRPREVFLHHLNHDSVVAELAESEAEGATWLEVGSTEFNEMFQLTKFGRDETFFGSRPSEKNVDSVEENVISRSSPENGQAANSPSTKTETKV